MIARNLCVFGILALTLSSVTGKKYEFPIFKEWTGKTPTNFMLLTAKQTENWGAAWPTDLKIILFGGNTFSMKLDCSVKTLSEEAKLTSMKFCFITSRSSTEKHCKVVTDVSDTMKVNDEAEVKFFFNSYNGGSATFENVLTSQDVTSIFTCEVTNERSTITSNRIYFYDAREKFPKEFTQVSKDIIIPMNGRFELSCTGKESGELDLPSEISSKYSWKYCKSSTYGDCNQQNLVVGNSELTDWPVQILKNGRLFIPYISSKAKNHLEGQYLICLMYQMPISFHDKPIRFSDDTTNEIKALKILYPTTPKMEIELLNSAATNRKLYCNFEVPKGAVTVHWVKQVDDKVESIKDPAVIVDEKDKGLIFDGSKGFTSKTQGIYKCKITWTTDLVTKTEEASYKVILQYFPEVSDDPVPVVYVPDKDNGKIDCKFKNPFPDLPKSEYWVTPSVLINGVALDLKSEVDFKKSVSSMNSRFAKYLSPLELSVTPINPSANVEIQYESKNMLFKNPATGHSSSHIVTCVGKNKAGEINSKTLLKVVPKPEIHKDDRPSNFKCSSCSSKEQHVIKCVVTNKHLYNTSDNNVEFRQFWRLGKLDLTEGKNLKMPVFNYVNISEDQSELTISKIGDEKDEIDIKKYINEEGNITCIITLAYAEGMKVPSDLSMKKTRVFFSTADDPAYTDTLLTGIHFLLQPKPKAASIAWIIPIVLSVLIVIIVIVLVIVWCRRRPPAETYNVDVAEKKQGNDPEAENQELQQFPVYQRPDDGPIRGSRASFDSNSIQVGDSDDEEDLAEYDADVGKFNEEGSFLGQYDSDPNKLPPVGTDTDV